MSEAEDYFNDPNYQAFVDDAAKYCHCTRGPCDGVLAGGMCDGDVDEDDDDEGWTACFFCCYPDCHNECLENEERES